MTKGLLALGCLLALGAALLFLVRGDAGQTDVRGEAAAAAPESTPRAAAPDEAASPAVATPRSALATASEPTDAEGSTREAVQPGAGRSRRNAPAEPAKARLSGALVSQDGPIPGAQLLYQAVGRAPLEVTSDARGAFTLVFQEPHVPGVLSIRARGFALFELGVGRLRPGENRNLGNVHMVAGAVLEGRVVGGANLGVPGALLTAASSRNIVNDGVRLLDTRSEKDGRFRLEDVPIGNVRVDVSAAGYGSRSIQVEAPASDLLIELGPGRDLAVQVRDEGGQGVAGAAVRLEPIGDDAPSLLATTDERGLARLEGLGPPLWNLVVTHEAYRPFSQELVLGEPTLEVTMQRWPCLVGLVRTPDDGPPPPGTRVFAAHRTQTTGRFAPEGEGTPPAPDGSFRLCPVFPGSYEVVVDAPGYARTRSERLDVPIEGTVDAGVVRLARGGSLVVVCGVEAPRGSRAELYSDTPHPGALWNADERSPFLIESRELAPDGSARFDGLELGPVWVVLRVEGRLPLVVGPYAVADGDERMTDALQPDPGGRIEGRLRDDQGAAVAGALVLIRGGTVDGVVRSTTDASGVFLSPALPAGSYRLWARVLRSGAEPLATEADVTVRSGETTEVTLGL